MSKLPRYKCHKEVNAFKIGQIEVIHGAPSGCISLSPWEIGSSGAKVSEEWFCRHQPEVGGYYVVYADGYASYSPADAFEQGYSLIEEGEG